MRKININPVKFLLIIWLVTFFLSPSLFAATDTISFSSEDGIVIAADTYIISMETSSPVIVLFHQAGWSRGEYIDIAPRLNEMGFNCIAVDLRSGKKINSIENLTAKQAQESNHQTRYIDALPDIISALRFVNKQFPENKIIAWGSSYSAALILHVAGKNPDLVDGVLAFSPGEYFHKQGKSKFWVRESSAKIKAPVFITSARNEKDNWSAIFDAIQSDQKTFFIPDSKGNHGSKALWEQFDDNNEYWNAVNQFLINNYL